MSNGWTGYTWESYGCVLLSQLFTDVGVHFRSNGGCVTQHIGNPSFDAFYSQSGGVYALYRAVNNTDAYSLAAPGSTIEIVHDDEFEASTLASDLYVGCFYTKEPIQSMGNLKWDACREIAKVSNAPFFGLQAWEGGGGVWQFHCITGKNMSSFGTSDSRHDACRMMHREGTITSFDAVYSTAAETIALYQTEKTEILADGTYLACYAIESTKKNYISMGSLDQQSCFSRANLYGCPYFALQKRASFNVCLLFPDLVNLKPGMGCILLDRKSFVGTYDYAVFSSTTLTSKESFANFFKNLTSTATSIANPTVQPIANPTKAIANPTGTPIVQPVAEGDPTVQPIANPTKAIANPTGTPIVQPVAEPMEKPTLRPTYKPTRG